LDVTSAVSVADAVDVVTKSTVGNGLDVLINNAGSGYTIPLVDADLDAGKQLFETNVWGLLAVTKAFMDLLLQAHGTVVNISSVGGEVNTPWIGRVFSLLHRAVDHNERSLTQSGIYSASKAAVTILSETLRLEVAPFGVHVQTVMVGSIRTTFWANEPAFVLPAQSRYQAIRSTIAKWASGEALPKGIKVEDFAENLVKDVLSRRGGQIWRGPNSLAVSFCSKYLPKFVMVRLYFPFVSLNSFPDIIHC
jgi:short-subunit dehydrogenase